MKKPTRVRTWIQREDELVRLLLVYALAALVVML